MERRDHGGCGKEKEYMGLINVVGTGPGGVEHITPEALDCLKKSDVIIGYSTYLELISPFIEGKKVLSSAMMQEVDRCIRAFEEADDGATVSIVSGGDPGIYAMAGLIYEIAVERDSDVDIHIVPGIAAVNGCAARLGAPLMHDFAAISLSDLLTPWEVIEKRLDAAASADFVIAIYNPKSKKRKDHIVKARDIVSQHRSGKTPVGIVTAATRGHEEIHVTTLDDMDMDKINMQSTVIIGNSKTFSWKGKLITPRGYSDKYRLTK
ncbi:precorrin-3B C(17)-methyltransferase [Desulfopila sp. IMCC35008]|uniref:precorrin-3B C(17)-methyltransferase n=1 Tax=Desulfopila sp. IMCC35008 TaxID=2653858 RepID=UPI00197AE397|nr:precorrin-3B C(17)-methyltransferase [Desulfopila sp. IMCC35008]